MKTKEELIFQALGEASMCWSETPKGVFETSRCNRIGEELIAALESAEALKPSHNSRVMQCCCTVLYVTDPDGNRLLRVNTDCPVHRTA